MTYTITTATKKLLALKKRIKAVCGGTSASKTISILMIFIDKAQSTRNRKMNVMSESFPHLEDGAIADFKAIMLDRGYWKDSLWNETKHFYKFETGSVIKFISIDEIGKAHGPRRGDLFVNEANNISWDIFVQLMQRTSGDIWIDWNPSVEFWYYTEIKDKIDHDFITLTYLDNEGLDLNTKNFIESMRGNKHWWTVYGLGQLGEVEGKIYKDWQILDEVPHEARLERYGLDFGYSNDPSALVAVYRYNGGYILDEIIYQKGLSNKQLADIIKNQDRALVVADSAEPKSIDEIRSYGVTILPATKGPGSIQQGIQFVQDQRISVTKHSLNIIREYRNYLWQTDKDGKIINIPDVGFDHTMDAIRYALRTVAATEKPKSVKESTPVYGARFSTYLKI